MSPHRVRLRERRFAVRGGTSLRRSPAACSGNARRVAGGFTLIELLIALSLFALMSAVLFGSLRLAGRTWDAGEAKAESTSGMRLAGDYLRSQLAAQHPQRMRKLNEFPLLFGGTGDEVRFAAPVPGRVGVGGMWYYRLAVVESAGKGRSALVLERMVPDVNATSLPDFGSAERSILADDIASIKIGYLGRDRGSSLDIAPTWRDRWDDPQLLPLLLRVDVAPRVGPAWPPLVVAPREAPEAGCRAWDTIRLQCVGV
jgi:general secretion pathway protein J